jgi:DNA-binding CsgD family transcriptional regulator
LIWARLVIGQLPDMNDEQHNVQKNISLLIAITGCIVVISNIMHLASQENTGKEIFLNPTVYLLFIFSLMFIVSRNLKHIIVPILQVSIIYINGIISILDNHEAFNGYGFIIITVLMMYKYGFLNSLVKTKLILLAVSIVLILEVSLKINENYPIGRSFNYIIYFIFFIAMVYILYKSELNRILKAEKKFKETLVSKEDELQILINEVDDHKAFIENTEIRISELCSEIDVLKDSRNPIDLSQYKITKREESIIRILSLNTELANKEIAAELGISEGTIKQNMNKIFKKLGIANRQKMIELCQNNFVGNPLTKTAAKSKKKMNL